MRHVPESMLPALLRILNEYEAELLARKKRTLADLTRLYHIDNIKTKLSKRYEQ